jgi:hypothetical protein
MATKITTVDEYIDQAEPHNQAILRVLRSIIQTSLPYVIEKISFGIPFYHHMGMCFYFNITKQRTIEVCLCRGVQLLETFPLLEQKNRAIIAGITLTTLDDIEQYNIKEVLICATEWNEHAKRMGIPILKSSSTKKKRSSQQAHSSKKASSSSRLKT